VAPAYALVDAELVKAVADVRGGRRPLILSLRTGTKDRAGATVGGDRGRAPILDLAGARVDSYDVLPAPYRGVVKSALSGKDHAWSTWAEVLKPSPGTTVLGRYGDQFYAGEAAVVTRTLGRGTVTYVGVETETRELEREVVRRVFTDAGVPSRTTLICCSWTGATGSGSPRTFLRASRRRPCPKAWCRVVGGRTLKPAEVAIWR
jgi:beta-galactosidase